MKIKPGLWLHGSSGRMGREIQKAVEDGKGIFRLIGGSAHKFEGEPFYQGRPVTRELLGHVLVKDDVDVIVDFSGDDANALLLDALKTADIKSKAVVIGTTGLAAERLAAWRDLARKNDLRVLVAPNTSVGILLSLRAALLAAAPLARLGFDVEITETHHRDKKDAPSGTARFLATALAEPLGLEVVTDRQGARKKGELGVHSVRGGGVYGEHEIRLLGDAEEIRISHRAFSRSLFAAGALVLADWTQQQKPGVYGLLDVQLDEIKA